MLSKKSAGAGKLTDMRERIDRDCRVFKSPHKSCIEVALHYVNDSSTLHKSVHDSVSSHYCNLYSLNLSTAVLKEDDYNSSPFSKDLCLPELSLYGIGASKE